MGKVPFLPYDYYSVKECIASKSAAAKALATLKAEGCDESRIVSLVGWLSIANSNNFDVFQEVFERPDRPHLRRAIARMHPSKSCAGRCVNMILAFF